MTLRSQTGSTLKSYVFTSEQGTQVSQSNLRNRVLVPAAEKVGIEGFTTYDLRHTAMSPVAPAGPHPVGGLQDGRALYGRDD